MKSIIKIHLLIFIFIAGASLSAQTRPGSLKGKVIEKAYGVEAIGANVLVKDSLGETVAGGVTDLNGNFNINPIPVGTYTVEITSIGFEKVVKENVSTFSNLATLLDAELEEEAFYLNEVVVFCGKPIIQKCRSGCTTTCTISTCCWCCRPADSTSSEPQKPMQIFPNPTVGDITVLQPGKNAKVALLDMQGRVIALTHTREEEKVSFNLGKLPAGTYLVKSLALNAETTQKVVLMK